ncbi:MAG: patatin-like phospholipase family protein, partial [Chloroflexota bacterium]
MNAVKVKPKVAIVIGSGSVKCAAALGMYDLLKQEAIEIDLIVGCSGGALFATLIAMGVQVDDAIERTKRLWTRDITQQRSIRDFLSVVFPKWLDFDENFGLNDDALILERLYEAYGQMTFADTQRPLYLTATDFHTGEQIVINEGKIVPAIRASMAIPFSFKPLEVDNRCTNRQGIGHKTINQKAII